jgi:predicted nucleic acid-binding protein
MPHSKVLDAWALLAWLRDEQPAADSVRRTLQEAEDGNVLSMSWINAGEVYYMLARKHDAKAAEEFLIRLPSLPIRLVVPQEEDIIAAAKLKSAYRISYADAFAAALGIKECAAVITGDPEIRDLTGILTVEWIGPQPPAPAT